MFTLNSNYNFNGNGLNPIDLSHILPQASATVVPTSTNFIGQLSLPNLFYPTAVLGGINPSGITTTNDNAQLPQVAQPQNTSYSIGGYPAECLALGVNCPDTTTGGLIGGVHDIFKKFALIMIALVLLGFGLFLLAESTKAGGAALNLATKL